MSVNNNSVTFKFDENVGDSAIDRLVEFYRELTIKQYDYPKYISDENNNVVGLSFDGISAPSYIFEDFVKGFSIEYREDITVFYTSGDDPFNKSIGWNYDAFGYLMDTVKLEVVWKSI